MKTSAILLLTCLLSVARSCLVLAATDEEEGVFSRKTKPSRRRSARFDTKNNSTMKERHIITAATITTRKTTRTTSDSGSTTTSGKRRRRNGSSRRRSTREDQERTGRKLKSSKDKKSSKSAKTTAPSTSTMPSLAPSPSPSTTPTISVQPSTTPSSSPTSKPSSSPTSQPSSTPSVSTRPSLQPTSQPSANPTSSPSTHPTAVPSRAPSSSPSLSSSPSSTPSIAPTNSPTVNTIVGLKSVDGGIQQGCPVPPNLDDANFAEESVQRIPVSFVYTIRFKQTAQEQTILSDMERDFQRFIFEDYINCNDAFTYDRSIRFLQIIPQSAEHEKPIGASSAPIDEMATDIMCSPTSSESGDETCWAMNGKFWLIFTNMAQISESEQEILALTAMKNAIQNGSLKPSNSDTIEMQYIGKRDASGLLSQSPGIIPITDMDDGGDSNRLQQGRGGVSFMGGMLMGASFLVLAVALFARHHHVKKHNEMRRYPHQVLALTSLRSNSKRHYDLCEIRGGSLEDPFNEEEYYDDDDYDSNAGNSNYNKISSQDADHNHRLPIMNKKHEAKHSFSSSTTTSFPIVLPTTTIVQDQEHQHHQQSQSQQEQTTQGNHGTSLSAKDDADLKYYHSFTQDVHRCNSALCQECSHYTITPERRRNKQVRFVPCHEDDNDDEDYRCPHPTNTITTTRRTSNNVAYSLSPNPAISSSEIAKPTTSTTKRTRRKYETPPNTVIL